jgi:hypothetical protein
VVLWAQAGVSFLVWIAYGIVQARRSEEIRVRVFAMPRNARTVRAVSLMLGGVVFLGLGLAVVQALGGVTRDGMTLWGWVLVTGVGLVFVHAQAMSMALLVSLALESVTERAPRTSSQESALRDTHEEPPA